MTNLVTKLNSTNELIWTKIGNIAEVMHDSEKAIFAYDNVLRHNPYNVKALTQIASICRMREQYPKAVEFFQRILNLENTNGEIWGALGHCYLMMDDLQKAYTAYQQALYHLQNPKDPNLWYGIGILYDRYGSFEHAEEAFTAVLKMDSKFEKANEIYFRLGIIYKQQMKHEQSLECFKYILNKPPRPLVQADIWFQIGHVYELMKDFHAAKDAYERVLKENANHAKVLQQLGWLYHHTISFGNQDVAINYLMKSIDADPNDGQTWYLLGRCYMQQQKYRKAYDAYQQAVYRDGRNPTFWCSIGVLYYQINQFRDALDAYSRAIRLNPYLSEVWYDLGTLYESCNQINDSMDAYQRAAELDPNNKHIQQRLTLLRTQVATGVKPVAVNNMQLAGAGTLRDFQNESMRDNRDKTILDSNDDRETDRALLLMEPRTTGPVPSHSPLSKGPVPSHSPLSALSDRDRSRYAQGPNSLSAMGGPLATGLNLGGPLVIGGLNANAANNSNQVASLLANVPSLIDVDREKNSTLPSASELERKASPKHHSDKENPLAPFNHIGGMPINGNGKKDSSQNLLGSRKGKNDLESLAAQSLGPHAALFALAKESSRDSNLDEDEDGDSEDINESEKPGKNKRGRRRKDRKMMKEKTGNNAPNKKKEDDDYYDREDDDEGTLQVDSNSSTPKTSTLTQTLHPNTHLNTHLPSIPLSLLSQEAEGIENESRNERNAFSSNGNNNQHSHNSVSPRSPPISSGNNSTSNNNNNNNTSNNSANNTGANNTTNNSRSGSIGEISPEIASHLKERVPSFSNSDKASEESADRELESVLKRRDINNSESPPIKRKKSPVEDELK
eukprot:TRINITY_DN3691_c0_g1_i1.p1 TRINITY_DN3691_c0_g1~~TRINITY_DN3691_c0_g1_i1.p1  ORF type:complete len:845 (-),score=192.51 TRINITY_DN3691_c0_g1_i1:47-2581(-)